jgi:hypothetical protein
MVKTMVSIDQCHGFVVENRRNVRIAEHRRPNGAR